MKPLHCLHFTIISVCVNVFTVFTYITFYAGQLSMLFHEQIHEEYDYIIVGAGTAGSLIAHRIYSETQFSYILLEEGSHGNWLFDIPMLGPLLHGSIYDWQYETVPQKNACLAMKGQKCRLPQGKIVGGSSKLNNMIHVRGNISHYASWFHGKYTENYIEKQFEFIEKEIIQLDELKYESDLADAVLQAAKELGYEHLDVNLKFKKGFMKSKVSQKQGKRWSTSNNIPGRNLLTNALVESVIMDDRKIARGVRFSQFGMIKEVFARKAVILSAGTYNTPKILQLSGIGPRELLQNLHISVISELPVGENLQDHVTTGLDLLHFNKTLNLGAFSIINPYNVYQYFVEAKGPLTTPGCEVVGFLCTENNSSPDIQFMVLPVGITADYGSHLRKTIGIRDDIWDGYFAKAFDKYTATILPILLHPKSKGSVRIRSRDAKISPLIDPQYLSHEDDIEVLIKGIKFVMEFVNTEGMKKIGAGLNLEHLTGCENFEIFSDLYWRCYITHLTLTSYHPVGTCSMGLPTSKTSVVDTSFKVIGVERLYVADGSVLPTLPSGNINAAIAMMASIFFETNIKTLKDVCKKKGFEVYSQGVCFV